ncbi:M23 family metallopeptidase [Conchiformibius steedae]|uniref:M23 family metallopeptidase n=1 Tax=Conchiformibius steedae TaxID=153493 RepID=UPI0026EC7677|nr:M23 family metallopeptidase [Conchiformibius steedae]
MAEQPKPTKKSEPKNINLEAALRAADNHKLEFEVPARGLITSPYGMRIHPVLGTPKFHSGIDIAARPRNKDIPILAAEDGKVSFVGVKGAYGNTIEITHDGGFTTRYAHLKDGFKEFVKEGQDVKQGQQIAIMGTTGRSTGVHLHYEIRHNGKHLDPAKFYDVDMSKGQMVKPSENTREKRRETELLQRENQLNENEKLPAVNDGKGGLDLLKSQGVNMKHVSQSTQQATIYALSKRDTFAALTFLSEGVDGRAFYEDPATNGKYGRLINMHPGITLNFQTPATRKKLLEIAGIPELENTVSHALSSNTGIQASMKGKTVSLKQTHEMFEVVRGNYSDVAERAVLNQAKKNPLAQKMVETEKLTWQEAADVIVKSMPAGTWATLQHAAYKKGNLNGFDRVVQSAINATLDDDSKRDQHLAEGAKYINYVYRYKGKAVHDTRVETLHRVFFVAGDKLDPRTEITMVQGKDLGRANQVVADIARQAGVDKVAMQGGKFQLPESPPELNTWKHQGIKPELDENALYFPSRRVSTQPVLPDVHQQEAIVGNVRPQAAIQPTATPATITPPSAPAQEQDKRNIFDLGFS